MDMSRFARLIAVFHHVSEPNEPRLTLFCLIASLREESRNFVALSKRIPIISLLLHSRLLVLNGDSSLPI